jgi:hypothetical protein
MNATVSRFLPARLAYGLRALLAAVMAAMLAGCAAVDPQVYSAEKPMLDLKTYFNGTLVGHGMFQSRSGKVERRFVVTIDAKWEGDVGTLDERFEWSDGEKQRRVWKITRTGEGTYTAMAQGGGGLKRDLPLESPPVASVEEIFTKSGLERAIVDIRSASKDNPGTHWAATQRLMRSVGALEATQQHFPTTPTEAFDMLVWQARTTASRAIE